MQHGVLESAGVWMNFFTRRAVRPVAHQPDPFHARSGFTSNAKHLDTGLVRKVRNEVTELAGKILVNAEYSHVISGVAVSQNRKGSAP
jgi:hypothetical protein